MTSPSRTAELLSVLRLAPVIPVLTIEGPEDALPMARALVAGGLPVLEITLRTPGALAGMEAIARQVPGAVVGAGTVLSAAQVKDCVNAGAKFLVSPGATPALAEAALASPAPLLPGVATASEAMIMGEMGYQVLKFFPAEPAGGVPYLKSLSAPLPHFTFCPTGGIDVEKAKAYLALPNVACVGGSWVTPAAALKAGDWATVEALAAAAAKLRG
ncbi:MAG: bifunctional 4-hydroxy-2-oxoglutarate aldolase/2-dehydro-3-deoxy-phosphogluconate aldolase [Alsobacter sp.]